MKVIILMVFLTVSCFVLAISDIIDFQKIKVEASQERIEYSIKLLFKTNSYVSDGVKENTYFTNGYILDKKLFLYSYYEKSIMSFNLSELSENMTPVDEFFLTEGKGPGEITFILDMQLHNSSIYISDGNNHRINIYDKEFNSTETIKTDFRPSKLSISDSQIIINTYDGAMSNEMGCIYNRKDKSFGMLIENMKPAGDKLSDLVERNLILESDNKGNIYLVRKFPDFTIHKFSDGNYAKSFLSPKLKKSVLPVPEFKTFNNDRKIWGLFSYKDIEYIEELDMLVTISLAGWEELAAKHKLKNMLTGYNDDGDVVMHYEFPEYIPNESCSILYDAQSKRLFVISGSVYVFEIEKIN